MDHDTAVLNLSDVVHDETIDDDTSRPSSPRQEQQEQRSTSYDHVLDPYPVPDPAAHHGDSYSVEMLEREIASLLNRNASAASAALLSAAHQQRQSGIDMDRPTGLDAGSDNIPGLGLGLNDLAAVLQAVHAHTRTENEQGNKEKHATRTTPAFHSLTAGESSQGRSGQRHGKGTSEGTDYLFSEREDTPEREELKASPPQDTPVAAGDELPSASGGFSDINDILNQFSAQFEPDPPHGSSHDLSAPDASPIISHEHQESGMGIPQSSVPVLAPSNRSAASQPVASTSFASPPPDPSAKRPRRLVGKERGPNVHVCEEEQCQKSFTRRSDLARHMRIHTGERPFICTYDNCGKTFIQRSALHVHSRVHTGEKPHCCEYPGCCKTFGDSSSLARHRRTHTGKRPYKCEDPSCEKTFTRRTTLTTHMRTHDPSWEPDPNVKYNFKGKKRKIEEEEEEDPEISMADSMLKISALLQAGASSAHAQRGDGGLDERVANISAEIAAAIVQAQSRVYEEDEEEEESGSGQERIGPTTSGIRGEHNESDILYDDDDDSDAFPAPLRSRKARELATVSGGKRKR